jgi:hypothetical protein
MEKDEYIFLPAADTPTLSRLWKYNYLLLGIITVAAAIAYFTSDRLWECVVIIIWIVVCSGVTFIRLTTLYVIEVRINLTSGVLNYSFMNYKGEIGNKLINIKEAKYSYKSLGTRSGEFGLTIQDQYAKLKIMETKSESNSKTNVFLKVQLGEWSGLFV